MKEIDEKDLEMATGGRGKYTYNCPQFELKNPDSPIAPFMPHDCAACKHFTGDAETLCDLLTGNAPV